MSSMLVAILPWLSDNSAMLHSDGESCGIVCGEPHLQLGCSNHANDADGCQSVGSTQSHNVSSMTGKGVACM